MDAREKVKRAGFKKFENENADDCCLFCNYYHVNREKNISSCRLHDAIFWDTFEASDYVCNRFDGSMLSSLFNDIANENLESTANTNVQKQNVPKKEGKIHKLINGINGWFFRK